MEHTTSKVDYDIGPDLKNQFLNQFLNGSKQSIFESIFEQSVLIIENYHTIKNHMDRLHASNKNLATYLAISLPVNAVLTLILLRGQLWKINNNSK